jgi:hypothetical protein
MNERASGVFLVNATKLANKEIITSSLIDVDEYEHLENGRKEGLARISGRPTRQSNSWNFGWYSSGGGRPSAQSPPSVEWATWRELWSVAIYHLQASWQKFGKLFPECLDLD